MSTKAQAKATARYEAKNYDQVKFRIKKGGRDYISELAEREGKSQAQFIRDLIIEHVPSDERQAAIARLVPNPQKDTAEPSEAC